MCKVDAWDRAAWFCIAKAGIPGHTVKLGAGPISTNGLWQRPVTVILAAWVMFGPTKMTDADIDISVYVGHFDDLRRELWVCFRLL